MTVKYNSHDEIISAIEKLRSEYEDSCKKPFEYTVECLRDIEMELEYTIAMNDAATWYNDTCNEGFVCMIGECMVRLLGGKWCIESGPRADNSRLKVLLDGKLYYPRDMCNECSSKQHAVSGFFDNYEK